jgi:hypothetical protein
VNPDKLFDYLDGRLSPEQRAALERRLASDPHLQRELVIAREIHSRVRDSREAMLTDETNPNRGAVLGRRVAIAFAALVFANVVFGLYAIGFLESKRRAQPSREQNRQDLVQALQKAAANALPTPSLEVEEIKIGAAPKERDTIINKVMAAAKQSGGSAVRNLSDENGTLLFAEIPIERVSQFREALAKLGAVLRTSTSPSSASGRAILQIRVVEGAK